MRQLDLFGFDSEPQPVAPAQKKKAVTVVPAPAPVATSAPDSNTLVFADDKIGIKIKLKHEVSAVADTTPSASVPKMGDTEPNPEDENAAGLLQQLTIEDAIREINNEDNDHLEDTVATTEPVVNEAPAAIVAEEEAAVVSGTEAILVAEDAVNDGEISAAEDGVDDVGELPGDEVVSVSEDVAAGVEEVLVTEDIASSVEKVLVSEDVVSSSVDDIKAVSAGNVVAADVDGVEDRTAEMAVNAEYSVEAEEAIIAEAAVPDADAGIIASEAIVEEDTVLNTEASLAEEAIHTGAANDEVSVQALVVEEAPVVAASSVNESAGDVAKGVIAEGALTSEPVALAVAAAEGALPKEVKPVVLSRPFLKKPTIIEINNDAEDSLLEEPELRHDAVEEAATGVHESEGALVEETSVSAPELNHDAVEEVTASVHEPEDSAVEDVPVAASESDRGGVEDAAGVYETEASAGKEIPAGGLETEHYAEEDTPAVTAEENKKEAEEAPVAVTETIADVAEAHAIAVQDESVGSGQEAGVTGETLATSEENIVAQDSAVSTDEVVEATSSPTVALPVAEATEDMRDKIAEMAPAADAVARETPVVTAPAEKAVVAKAAEMPAESLSAIVEEVAARQQQPAKIKAPKLNASKEPVAPKKRGRKSFKEIDAESDLIQLPDDEALFEKQYYPISVVAGWFNVNASLLRFWENEFDILKPRKNRKGDRLFRPEDVKNLQVIYYLLRQRKFTIEGAKEYLKTNKKKADTNTQLIQSLNKLRGFLLEFKANIHA